MIHDVVIVGAGPVGLLLASELRLAGASVLVLERATDPSSALKELPFGRRGLTAPTLEALDRRGLLAELGAEPAPAAGHFAGIPFHDDDVDTARWTYRLPSPAGTQLATTMRQIEDVLSSRAAVAGVEIVRGVAVEQVEQSRDEVAALAGGHTFLGRWLVGCDGGRSTVRKAGGFEFVGTAPTFTGYSVQVELADGGILPLGRHHTPAGMYMQMRPGTVALADFDGGAAHRSVPLTREHVQDVLRRVAQVDAEVTTLRQATTWTDRAQQATDYRRGRILLAGDAAHVHSPLGGQGLNLGLGDAVNLGWKLGATVTGTAARELLDTYVAERHPVGAAVLERSRAQVALMEPATGRRALAGIIGDLIATRDGATYFAEQVWGATLRYDLGGRHPLIGRSAPDFALGDGDRLGVVLRDGVGVLLDFGHRDGLRALAERLTAGLRYYDDVPAAFGLSAVLVRPDGVVAWACDGDVDVDEVVGALWLASA